MLIKRAKANLRTAIAQNEKRLTFPELFSPIIPLSSRPLYWSGKFSKRDLIELITALTDLGSISTSDGKPIAFITAVQEISTFLNVTISSSQAYNERDNIKSIKHNPAAFTEQLVATLKGK